MQPSQESPLASSFRDPNGFVFCREGVVYRQINESYKQDYNYLVETGLYDRLTKQRLLVPHTDQPQLSNKTGSWTKVIQPEQIPFISYPYEWCFGQLKDAALLTLKLQKEAFQKGMTLKDASAYNVQFIDGKPIFIDTLSFEKYIEGEAWVAYKQLCQHFIAPLILMSRVDIRLGQLTKNFIDGIPLDLTSKLLPWSSWLSLSSLVHIHFHARAQNFYSDKGTQLKSKPKARVSKLGFAGLIDNLEGFVRSIHWQTPKTEWGNYYSETNYSDDAFEEKKALIVDFIKTVPKIDFAIDLGSNTGVFSRLIAQQGAQVVSADIDPVAVEKNYQQIKKDGTKKILPLIIDLNNPSPDIGWANDERTSFLQRRRADLVLALALIHHIVISNNIPLAKFSQTLAQMSDWLILEFVPKEDSQVKRLLASRTDIFTDYHLDGFERAFSTHFKIIKKQSIAHSERTLFLLKKV